MDVGACIRSSRKVQKHLILVKSCEISCNLYVRDPSFLKVRLSKDVQTPLLMLPQNPDIKAYDAFPNPCLNPINGRDIPYTHVSSLSPPLLLSTAPIHFITGHRCPHKELSILSCQVSFLTTQAQFQSIPLYYRAFALLLRRQLLLRYPWCCSRHQSRHSHPPW